jgi:hypothetical protein
MAMSIEDKVSKAIIDACADDRLVEVTVGHKIARALYTVQARFWNIIVAYIYTMAYNYEIGHFPHGTYEIARMSKKVKDLCFEDEYTTKKYERYGDYELSEAEMDLTQFDR